jgi:hypothetical protein
MCKGRALLFAGVQCARSSVSDYNARYLQSQFPDHHASPWRIYKCHFSLHRNKSPC